MNYGDPVIWGIALALGVGTFLIRLSFLGLLGGRPMPGWILRCLRFAPVAVFPAIVAPLVASPAATGGDFDPARFLAAITALGIAVATRDVLKSIGGGVAVLYLSLWLLG